MKDLKAIAQNILEGAQIYKKDHVEFTDGPVDVVGGVLLVTGNCGPGSVIRGQGDVVIEGSIHGNERSLCRIDVTGRVIVLGSVAYAQIQAHLVRIGAPAKGVQITAHFLLSVDDDLIDAKVNLGGYEQDKREIDFLFSRLSDAVRDQKAIERQLKIDEKRVDKLFKNTRIVLSSNVGQILQTRRNRIVIDLKPIYKTLEGRSESEVDKALQEFFAKAIVGLLTRANRHFLVGQSKHRQEIFKGVIRDVHDFFFLARSYDKQEAKAEELDQAIDARLARLNGRHASLEVSGRLVPEVHLVFTVPEASRVGGEAVICGDVARMKVQKGEGPNQIKVERVNTLGDDHAEAVETNDLKNCQLGVTDGEIEWKSTAGFETAVA